MWLGGWVSLPEVTSLPSLETISPMKVEIFFFFLNLSRDLTLVTRSMGQVLSREIKASQHLTQFVYQYVICKWRYNELKLSHDLSRPSYLIFMWLYGWELVMVCHQLAKFGDHRHYDSGDLNFSFFHVNSRNYLFRWSWDIKFGRPSPKVTILLSLVASGMAEVEM